MKKIICILLMLMIIPSALAFTLKSYPGMFTNKNQLDVKIVVGDLAIASDTIGAVEIATSLQYNPTTNKTYIGVQAVLASEIEDVSQENLIIVGGPCANAIAAELMNYPNPCYSPIPDNTGILRLYEFDYGVSILVAGRSAIDTRRASRIIANYYDYNLANSKYMEVFAALETQILIN